VKAKDLIQKLLLCNPEADVSLEVVYFPAFMGVTVRDENNVSLLDDTKTQVVLAADRV
jgi:hypothetical protein